MFTKEMEFLEANVMIIGVCDDQAEERERICKVCEKVLKQMKCPAETALYEDASFVLQADTKPDILILDIEMPGMSGIELKDELQHKEGTTYIIFVTDHEEMIADAFGLHVLRFVQKENLEDKLPEALAQAVRMKRNNCIVHGTASEKILYINSLGNYIQIVTESGKQPLIRESMKQLKKTLEGCPFIEIKRGCLVNIAKIEKIKSGIVVAGDEQLEISKRKQSEVTHAYLTYYKEA